MDVVIFTFILDSFPRYNNAMKRISDILDRAKTLLYTVGKSHLSNTSIKRIHHDILKIYHCEKEGLVKLDLNADKLAMKSHGVPDKLTCKFDNTKSFLTHYLNSFSSTNVLIFQYYNGLIQTLEKCLPPEQPVIIVAKKQNGNITETYCHPNWKTVSTEENISEEISSLLEQMAFLPMTKTFENIKSIFEESHEHKVSTPLSSTNGMYSSKHNLSKFIDGEIRIPGDVSREMNGFKRKLDEIKGNDHTKMKGFKRKLDEMKENVHAKRKGNSDALPVYDNAYIRKTRSGTLLGTSQGYSDALPVNDNAYIRKTRRGTLLGTSEDKSTVRKCMKNKAEFQRLLGEMIGMYRRSKLPENLKPQLNGPPEGEVSEQVMMKLYKISPSIRGYSYKFITRLQIHVLSDDIERLKQEIAEELEKHGFTSDSYDIVPPLDDVRPFIKILAGSKVCNTVQNEAAVFGTLTGFVKMESYEQKETICCSLASKHLLDGQKTIQISNREQTMTAAVIKETAPGDSNMYVDIAAAIINKEDEKYCDGRFKTEDGKLIKGIMFTKDDSLLACQHVHINGASTSLGLGIIATTHCNNRESIETRNGQKQSCERKEEIEKANEDDKFIYVESRKKSSPFCTGGDSGAMVCADDDDGNHVELISTVIGKVVNQRETEQCGAENVKVKDNVVYQTLRLETGVTHLKKLIKSEIDFFES